MYIGIYSDVPIVTFITFSALPKTFSAIHLYMPASSFIIFLITKVSSPIKSCFMSGEIGIPFLVQVWLARGMAFAWHLRVPWEAFKNATLMFDSLNSGRCAIKIRCIKYMFSPRSFCYVEARMNWGLGRHVRSVFCTTGFSCPINSWLAFHSVYAKICLSCRFLNFTTACWPTCQINCTPIVDLIIFMVKKQITYLEHVMKQFDKLIQNHSLLHTDTFQYLPEEHDWMIFFHCLIHTSH